MDDRGYWHDGNESKIAAAFATDGDSRGNQPIRPVMELGVNETVRIITADGSYSSARFQSAEKNKVTLIPCEGPRPYLELAQRVTLERESTGDKIKAQVWDNRDGKIILRTLPVHAE